MTWDEAERLWRTGSSVLIYQHYRREKRDAFVNRLARELRSRLPSASVEGFSTAHVLFLLAVQPKHVDVIRDAIALDLPRWQGQGTPPDFRTTRPMTRRPAN